MSLTTINGALEAIALPPPTDSQYQDLQIRTFKQLGSSKHLSARCFQALAGRPPNSTSSSLSAAYLQRLKPPSMS
jgi:hypothetical protein